MSKGTVRNPYLEGNFAPVREEVTAFDLPVTGRIPSALNGRLLRVGPNPLDADPATHHWFLGNGMVHGVRLRDGRAEWYRNRYVRDDEVSAALGEEPIPGPKPAMGSGTANTNVVGHAGRTLAIVEAGNPPVELTEELESVRRNDFEGTLPASFTAHPKRDPATGELHAACYQPGQNLIQHVVVGVDGRVRRAVNVPVPGSPMVHDCSLTESWFVLLDLPCVLNVEAAQLGTGLPYRWTPDYGARVGLLPREGAAEDVIWFEVEPCYVYHPMNSYEDGQGRVILDVCRHPKMFDTELVGPNEGPPTLDRWTLDLASGTVKEERLDDRGQEFPRHDERLIGRPYRYGYTVGEAEGFEFAALYKHDLEKGTCETQSQGAHRKFLEPVFVPAGDDAAEDEGWVMAYLYDQETNRSDVVILAAGDFAGEPVATIHLPTRVPFGFHGNWLPDA